MIVSKVRNRTLVVIGPAVLPVATRAIYFRLFNSSFRTIASAASFVAFSRGRFSRYLR